MRLVLKIITSHNGLKKLSEIKLTILNVLSMLDKLSIGITIILNMKIII